MRRATLRKFRRGRAGGRVHPTFGATCARPRDRCAGTVRGAVRGGWGIAAAQAAAGCVGCAARPRCAGAAASRCSAMGGGEHPQGPRRRRHEPQEQQHHGGANAGRAALHLCFFRHRDGVVSVAAAICAARGLPSRGGVRPDTALPARPYAAALEVLRKNRGDAPRCSRGARRARAPLRGQLQRSFSASTVRSRIWCRSSAPRMRIRCHDRA